MAKRVGEWTLVVVMFLGGTALLAAHSQESPPQARWLLYVGWGLIGVALLLALALIIQRVRGADGVPTEHPSTHAIVVEGKGRVNLKRSSFRGITNLFHVAGKGRLTSEDLDVSASDPMPVVDPLASLSNEELAERARRIARELIPFLDRRAASFPMEFLSDKSRLQRRAYFKRQQQHLAESGRRYAREYQAEVATVRDSLLYRGLSAPNLQAFGRSGYHGVGTNLIAQEFLALADQLSPEIRR